MCAVPETAVLGELRDLYAVKHAGEASVMGAWSGARVGLGWQAGAALRKDFSF